MMSKLPQPVNEDLMTYGEEAIAKKLNEVIAYLHQYDDTHEKIKKLDKKITKFQEDFIERELRI